MNRKLRALVAAALFCTVLAVVLPVFLIYPFREQTERIITFSYRLRQMAPWITIVCAGTILFSFIRYWREFSIVRKALAVIAVLISFLTIWFSLQNHFEWMFRPLQNPSYVRANQVNFLEHADMVLSVAINGDAAAYPVRFLAYHHLVQDVVGGQPVVATY